MNKTVEDLLKTQDGLKVIRLICDNSVTTQNVRFFRREFWRFWSAI